MKYYNLGSILGLLCLSMPAFAISEHVEHLQERCKKAAPTLDCENLSQEELESLARMCSDSKLSRSPWSGYGIGGKETRDKTGKLIFTIDPLKQGSANGRTPCQQIQAYRYPRTEVDVVKSIEEARIQGWRVKAVGAAHTDNELICGDGMAISNRFMNQILDLQEFEGQQTVRAQPGVTIRQLGEWLHAQQKSLGFAVVGYEAVTLAGVIGTGAHGSAIHETSILSDVVQSLRMVMADGSVREFSRGTTGQENPDLWSALTLNLGLMGVVTELRLRVREEFQMEVVTTRMPDAQLFENQEGVWPYVKDCDSATLFWFPERVGKSGRVIRNCGKAYFQENETWKDFSKNVDRGAQMVLHAPVVSRLSYSVFKNILHEGACDPDVLLSFEKIRRRNLVEHPPYARDSVLSRIFGKRADLKHLVPHHQGVRGWSFAMQNSVGSYQGNEFRQADWEVAVPVKKSPEVFRFLREFFNGRDPSYNKVVPLQLIGLYIRFSQVSETLMSHASAGGDFKLGETVMFLEIPEFLPIFDARNEAEKKISDAIMEEYERPYRTFVIEMIKRFGARVHWAKNRMQFFETQKEVSERAHQISKFAQLVNAVDPEGVFGSSFSQSLLQTR